MKSLRVVVIMAAFLFIISLAGCSSNESSMNKEMSDSGSTKMEGEFIQEQADQDSMKAAPTADNQSSGIGDSAPEVVMQQTDRMIAYEANVSLQVKSLSEFIKKVTTKTSEIQGYVVESNVYQASESYKNGHMSVRIPQKDFQSFLAFIEGESKEVYERSVRGQDVTEEYVDLESRLKAKRAVESRLLAFLEEANKTEDLLKISNDLARVQEEIEQVEGRMKYLNNRVDFATVWINISEAVNPKFADSENLDTWEKTKQAFVSSINGLLTFASGLLIFVVGYSPILVLLIAVGLLIWWIVRKRSHKKAD